MVEVVEVGGDTLVPPTSKKQKKNRISAGKFWEGCHYNYTSEEMVELVEVFKAWDSCKWTFGEEVGTLKGTPHLQISVHHDKICFRPMEKFKTSFHIAWVKGRKDGPDAAHRYARKDGKWQSNYTPAPSLEPDVMELADLPEWSQKVVAMVAENPLPDKRDRSLHWFYSIEGKMHKTETARYLVINHGAVVVQGGRKHVLAVAYKNPAPIYIVMIPRCDEGYVSYGSMELLKDALFMSGFGTEATGMVNRAKPWVIIMANFRHSRDPKDMSMDRWVETCVDKPPVVPPYEPKIRSRVVLPYVPSGSAASSQESD
jgi:hypothetical protein